MIEVKAMKKTYKNADVTVISLCPNENILTTSPFDGEDMDAADLLAEEIQDYLDHGLDYPR